ncbi:MAG: hypothetical protein P4L82_20940 [Ancalomicrobiaceae bacterium]|nr:hypothetical protein [Ancalomicrobiaceae bacterium]
MTKTPLKMTAPQLETATLIEREASRLRELAMKSELKFLAYLIDMAREEAANYAHADKPLQHDPHPSGSSH